MTKPVRVLIVDDSAVIRQLLSMLLSEDPEIEVVGTVSGPIPRWTSSSTWLVSLPSIDRRTTTWKSSACLSMQPTEVGVAGILVLVPVFEQLRRLFLQPSGHVR